MQENTPDQEVKTSVTPEAQGTPKSPEEAWGEACAASNQTMLMASEEMKKIFEEYKTKQEEFRQFCLKYDKANAEWSVYNKQTWHQIRTMLEKQHNLPEIYGFNIGLNMDALEQGVFVINITPGQPV